MTTPDTESVHTLAARLDLLSTLTYIEAMHDDSRQAFAAVRLALPDIARLSDRLADRLRRGGRLILAGAGTSGRLAALEAAECPPTFGTSPEQIVALVAGGPPAMLRSIEGAEDDATAGSQNLAAAGASPDDLVLGVSASGSTPYVRGVLKAARERESSTAAITCNPDSPLSEFADLTIVLHTGPEFVAGSTRLKAGTAEKLALNLLTTSAMRSLGRVREGRMVALRATNAKLRRRAIDIIRDLAEVGEREAEALLDAADGDVAVALAHVVPGAARSMRRDPLAVELRPLTPADAPAVTMLASDPGVVATTAPFATIGGERLFRDWLARPGLMLGAWDGDRLVGVVLAERRNAPLREHLLDVSFVAVADAVRRRGVGDRLIDATLDRARSAGLTRVELRVWPDNLAAIRLYERHGFEVEGRLRRHAVVDGRYVDALVMAWLDPAR